MSYVKAAKQLPNLDNEAIDAKVREYGFALEEEGDTFGKNNEKAEIGSRGSSQSHEEVRREDRMV